MKLFTKQNSSLYSLHGKIGIQIRNTVYTSKEKNEQFKKKNSATKHSPPSNVYHIEFYRKFLFEYSLIGIVKAYFTRGNEIGCRILEIVLRSVQKCAQNTGSNVLKSKQT